MRYAALFPAFALALSACASTEQATPTESQPTVAKAAPETAVMSATTEAPATRDARFDAYKRALSARAVAKGYDAALVARTIGTAEYYERTLDRDKNQPEFTKPVWDYIRGAASPARIERGRQEMAEHRAQLKSIEAEYGVPDYILGSIWGLETSYGRILGNFDLFTTLATLGFDGRRRDWAEQQIFAALDLIQAGDVREDQLVGAWAGAMGMTQFIPTTFRDYAVDFDGDGNKDLWNSEADALASAANYLSRSGWRRGVPVVIEVTLPDGFDYGQTETVKKSVGTWNAMGVRPAAGGDWPLQYTLLETRLLTPAGHTGPKLLAFDNFRVLQRYNNSSSYVMGIASLGEALNGGQLIRAGWPAGDQGLTKEQKEEMQRALTAKGYDTKGIDGLIGPATRAAIRAWQADNGLPADGYVEQRLYRRIVG